jgi:hypothetical protein
MTTVKWQEYLIKKIENKYGSIPIKRYDDSISYQLHVGILYQYYDDFPEKIQDYVAEVYRLVMINTFDYLNILPRRLNLTRKMCDDLLDALNDSLAEEFSEHFDEAFYENYRLAEVLFTVYGPTDEDDEPVFVTFYYFNPEKFRFFCSNTWQHTTNLAKLEV